MGLLPVIIRGRCRIRRGYILGRDSHGRRWRGACLAIGQSPRPFRRLDRRLWWRNDLYALLGLSVLCLGRSCSIPVLASFRIRPTCHRRMLTLWYVDIAVVYCAIIRWPACLRPAEGVSRHSSGLRGSRSSLGRKQRRGKCRVGCLEKHSIQACKVKKDRQPLALKIRPALGCTVGSELCLDSGHLWSLILSRKLPPLHTSTQAQRQDTSYREDYYISSSGMHCISSLSVSLRYSKFSVLLA